MRQPEDSAEQYVRDVTPSDLQTLGWQSFTDEHSDLARAARAYANLNLTPQHRQTFFHGVVFAHFIETVPVRQEQLADEIYRLLEEDPDKPSTQD